MLKKIIFPEKKFFMKIYITGSVGSGKTTLARRISQKTGVPCFHLDEIVYEECPEDSWGNKKRPPEERDALFAAALAQPHFIMEDAGRKCFLSAPEQADRVILLDISPVLRRYRIISRWLRQKLGLEKCIYRPHLAMLRSMLRWAKNYETGKDSTKALAQSFPDKLIILHTAKEIRNFLAALGPDSSIPP